MVATPKEWMRWAGADLPPLDSWSRGNVTLIGDAAHATLPFLAQGAVMSLEDACVLAQSAADGEGFGRYEELRRPRTQRIQQESLSLAAIYHARGIKALARNAALKLMGGERLINRLSWIYEWKVPDGPPV
jgi:salicylate hydroxylase